MSHSERKSTQDAQHGLAQLGNTCYLNTAIQTLLAYPDLPTIVAVRQCLLDDLNSAAPQDAVALCNLLVLLLAKQHGQDVAATELTDAWNIFLDYMRARVNGRGRLGSQQEDSSFALNLFFDMLAMKAPISQQVEKRYEQVTVKNRQYPALVKPEPGGLLPCPVLKWTSDTQITSIFQNKTVRVLDATHPEVREALKGPFSDADGHGNPCNEVTRISFGDPPVAPSAFTILPDHVVKLGGQDAFAPTRCHYEIPSEFQLEVNGDEHTYVLASFGQKIGSPSGGHYVAYRREYDQWYEINDGHVTCKGEQAQEVVNMPRAITQALASTREHCARQLVYVEKQRFLAQYQAQPVVRTAPPPIVPEPIPVVRPQLEPPPVPVQPEPEKPKVDDNADKAAADLLKKQKEIADTAAAVVASNNPNEQIVKKDGEILKVYAPDTHGKEKRRNVKRWVWRGVLIAAVVIGIGVLVGASMGAGLGVLAGVLLAVGLDQYWQHRNRKFKARTLLEMKQQALTSCADAYADSYADSLPKPKDALVKVAEGEKKCQLSEAGMAGFNEAVHHWPLKYLGRFWANPNGERAKGHALKDLGFEAEKAPTPEGKKPLDSEKTGELAKLTPKK